MEVHTTYTENGQPQARAVWFAVITARQTFPGTAISEAPGGGVALVAEFPDVGIGANLAAAIAAATDCGRGPTSGSPQVQDGRRATGAAAMAIGASSLQRQSPAGEHGGGFESTAAPSPSREPGVRERTRRRWRSHPPLLNGIGPAPRASPRGPINGLEGGWEPAFPQVQIKRPGQPRWAWGVPMTALFCAACSPAPSDRPGWPQPSSPRPGGSDAAVRNSRSPTANSGPWPPRRSSG